MTTEQTTELLLSRQLSSNSDEQAQSDPKETHRLDNTKQQSSKSLEDAAASPTTRPLQKEQIQAKESKNNNRPSSSQSRASSLSQKSPQRPKTARFPSKMNHESDTEEMALPPIDCSEKPRTARSCVSSRSERSNKLYRTPDSRSDCEIFRLEKSFIIDAVAVSTMQNDFFPTNPKLGAVIFPYNSQRDRHCKTYFQKPVVTRLLKKTGQDQGGYAIAGTAPERFHNNGYLNRYFSARNRNGMGHSLETIRGHMIKPSGNLIGYGGEYGFRRNTPQLRQTPSPFGIQSRGLPLH